MRRVWIAQCLCPQRHAILATSGEADSEPEAIANVELLLLGQIARRLADGTLNPWCGICRAPLATWRFELRRTRFETMAEALPELRELEADQAQTRAMLGDKPRSNG